MKIITKKKADEILKRITANEIIGIEYIKDMQTDITRLLMIL